MPVLATVRNTGTHTAHHLLRHFKLHFLTEDIQADRRLWFGHAETENLPRFAEKRAVDGPMILTMRHPLLVADSWRRRGRKVGEDFKAMWRNLFSLQGEDTYWLPIDTPDRDRRLEALSTRLGVDLDDDWPVHGHYEGDLGANGMDHAELVEFCQTLPFGQFYGDIR